MGRFPDLGVRQLLDEAIRVGVFPGAAYAFGVGKEFESGYLGRVRYEAESDAVSRETLWDLASLTKVVVTTTLCFEAWKAGSLSLESPVAKVLPSFGKRGKGQITARHLLTHSAGLIPFRPYALTCHTRLGVYRKIDAEELQYEVGTKSLYSDLSMIVLSRLLERLAGQSLESLAEQKVFSRFGMQTAGFQPNPARCAPTEKVETWRARLRKRRGTTASLPPEWIQGEVHDPTATVIGSSAGHAGLFASLEDLVRFLLGFMAEILPEMAIGEPWTRPALPFGTRALGWDTKSAEGSSAGTRFGPRSFGHTGFTGTSVWVDPEGEMWAILLSNRVHPTAENGQILAFRPFFHDAVAKACGSG